MKNFEPIYKKGKQLNVVPYTEPLAYLVRKFGNGHGKNLLEVGCGAGNNLIFAKWMLGFNCTGIDISGTAIDEAIKRSESKRLYINFFECDISRPGSKFDAVIDRACLQHNSKEDRKRIVRNIYSLLKPKGVFYSSMDLSLISPKEMDALYSDFYIEEKTLNNHIDWKNKKEIVNVMHYYMVKP